MGGMREFREVAALFVDEYNDPNGLGEEAVEHLAGAISKAIDEWCKANTLDGVITLGAHLGMR